MSLGDESISTRWSRVKSVGFTKSLLNPVVMPRLTFATVWSLTRPAVLFSPCLSTVVIDNTSVGLIVICLYSVLPDSPLTNFKIQTSTIGEPSKASPSTFMKSVIHP